MKSLIIFLACLICINSFSQDSQLYQNSINCLDLQIEVLIEPFCQGSFNGGKLNVNVIQNSGSGDYSYEWLDENGGFLPGGPQTNSTTLSFLTVNQTCWVYVTDNVNNCTDSASFMFTDYSCQHDTASLEVQSPFDINPVGYNQYSTCDIKLDNLGCELNFKPEFIISHSSENIELDDFIIEFYNAQMDWEEISYSINANGDAVGYWGSQDGEVANCDYTQVRPVRVKFNQFNPTAPTGEYSANLRLWSVDESGNLLSIVSDNAYVNLTLEDTLCEDLSIVNSVTDASCSANSDGQIMLSAMGGNSPHLFSINNSPFSSDSIFLSQSFGVYYVSVKDINGCQNSDTLFLGPEPILPDSLWFSTISPHSVNIFWNVDSLVDGYRFRYRESGYQWDITVASGEYSNGIAEMLPSKMLTNLTPSTVYEVQVKAKSLTACVEGWSTETYTFVTPMESYSYDVDNSCLGVNSGQIQFDVESLNSYDFIWQGPNGFSSNEASIFNLFEGDYYLQIFNNSIIIFDTTFVVSVSDSDIGVSFTGDTSLVSYYEQDEIYIIQACDMSSYLTADSGYSNYSWHYGNISHYVQSQQILIDTSDIFLQVEALDTNNCTLTSDSIHVSIVSDFISLIDENTDDYYINEVYNLCSDDSALNLDISPIISGNYSIEWKEMIGDSSIILSDNSIVTISPTENASFMLNISDCSFDFQVNYFSSPSIEVQHTNLLCFGDSNATVYVSTDASSSVIYTLIDSLGNITYSNNTSSLFDVIENITAGRYSIEITDEYLCDTRQDIYVLQADSLFFDSLQVQHVECFGQNSGSVAFKLSGGTNPYHFILNGDTTTLFQNIQGYYYIDDLYPSNYTIEVVDSNGCYRSLDFEILDAAEMVFSINSYSNIISCFGDSTAFINLNASGGAPNYTFDLYSADSLLTQQSTSMFLDLPANDYKVIMTDSFGCSDSLNITINQNSPLTITEDVSMHQDIFCNGDSTGFISFVVEGGDFNSDSDFFTVSLDSLSAGYYFYEITDSSFCSSISDTIQITEPIPIEISLISLQNINCSNSLGSVEFQLQGGTLPYFYTINSIDTIEVALPNQIITLNNLVEGEHNLNIFDNNSCADSLSFSIENHTSFNLSIFDISDTLSCYGDTTGYVQVDVGLAGTYNYSLIQEAEIITPQQQSSYFSSLTAGDYIVVVIDEYACEDSIQFTIVENSELVIYEDLDLHQDVLCDGSSLGSITTIVDGGVAPYSVGFLGDSLYAYPHQFNNLSIGNYEVLLKDSEDCSQEFSFSIIVDEVVVSDSLDLHQDVSCYGENDGEFMLHIESIFSSHLIRIIDTSSSEYPWYNHPHLFHNLSGGTYQVEVATSIDDECAFIYEVQVVEPEPFLLDSIFVSDVICKGDSTGVLEIFFDEDVLEYSYLLNNDSSILSNNLYATTYSLEISDTNGCTIDTNFTINEPEELILSVIDSLTVDVSCYGINDGQIGLTAIGGIPPYKFSILGEEPQDTNVINELMANTFTVMVTDYVGCEDTISVVVSQPESSVSIDAYELSDSLGYCTLCYADSTGFIDITVSGGTPDYFYFIESLSDTFYSPHIENLIGGQEYKFFAIDVQGCSSDTITVTCTSPEELILDIEIDTLPLCCYSCDSEVLLSAEGGIGPYSYAFEDSVFQFSGFFNQLCGDSSYFFRVKDNHGCMKQETTFEMPNRPCLTIDTLNFINSELPALIHYDICQEDGTAKIYVSANEGFGSYAFSIDNEPFVQQNQIIFDSLFHGSHSIIVKDQYNCLDTLSFVVNDPNPIVISELTIDTIFCGAPTINSITNQSDVGMINAVASGAASGSYLYSLDEIDSLLYQPTGLFENLDSGYYSMNIIDLNDCIQEFDFYIPLYSANVDYSVSDISCPNFSDGLVEIDSIIGEFDPWITLDNDTAYDSIFSSLSVGEYNLEVHYLIPNSSEICSFSQTIEILDKDSLEFSYDLSVPSCNAICDGSISIGQISGGTSPYTLLCVNTADTSLIFDNLCAGNYAIKMIDSNGCFKIQDIVMSEPNAIYPIIDFQKGQLVVLEPTTANPFSGIPPFSYQWYNSNGPIVGANDSLFEPALNGNYLVEVTDGLDCVGLSSFYNIEVLSMSSWHNDVVDIYPNPFEDIIHISLSTSDEIHWTLFDARGRHIQASYNAISWSISTSELVNGIYFLKLKKGNNELIYKIIKQ